MRLVFGILAGLALVLIGESETSASTITWELSGLVTVGDVKVPVGTSIGFTLTFDTAQPDQCSLPGAGQWFGSSSAQIFGTTTAAFGTGLEVNNPAGNCTVPIGGVVTARMAGFPFPFAFGGAAIQTESSLSPDTFPLDAFRTGDGFFFGPVGNAYDGSGTITQVEVTPEPTSILLTATGVAWLIRRRRPL